MRSDRPLLFLTSDCLWLALAGARIGMRALATNREPLAVAQATVAGEVHKALDVHRHGAAKIALDRVIAIDGFAYLQDFGVRQVLSAISTALVRPIP